jgi:hypothetical protein
MKRKVKRYADGDMVESSDTIETPKFDEKEVESKFDVEGMKRGIAAGTPTDRQTARDLQSFKAAEVRYPVKKRKPKAEPKASQSFPVRDFEAKTTTIKATPAAEKSSGLGALGAGAGAVAAGLLAARKGMQSGTRMQRTEPTMGGSTRSPVRSMTAEEAAFENEGGRYYKKGGKTKKMASGGSASSRGDGIAQRGKTKGRIC